MIELEVQRYLRAGGDPNGIANVKASRDRTYSNLWLFKYDDNWSFDEPIVRECRGLILDASRNWDIVAFPFTKFFNAGEKFAAPIDWATARVLEKRDGTLCVLYYYQGWRFATTGTPDAGGPMGATGITFADAFKKAWDSQELVYPEDTDVTIMMEFTSPYNKIVVQYDETCLTVLGGRNIITGREFTETEAARMVNGQAVATYPLATLNDIVKMCESLNGSQSEGFVVVDGTFQRIKIKSPDYARKHALKGSWSPKNALEAVLLGKADDLIACFPEWKTVLTEIESRLNAVRHEIDRAWASAPKDVDQKTFAMAVKDGRHAPYLFMRRKKEISAMEYLQHVTLDRVADLIDINTLPITEVVIE